MHKRKLLWQLYPSYLIIAIFSLIAVSWYLSVSFKKFYMKQTAEDLKVRAHLIEDQVFSTVTRNIASVDSLCKDLGSKASTRITVVLPSGKVIGDSGEDPATLDNHADRPELIEAFNGNVGVSVRYSFTKKEDMMYVAVPLTDEGQIRAALRVSIHLYSLEETFGELYSKVILAFFLIIMLVAAVSYFIASRLRRPLEELRQGADLFAQGHLDRKIRIFGSAETSSLAQSMNRMAEQLSDRMKTVVRQQKQQEAILSSMVEGVLAVDNEQHVIIMNKAAMRLLKTEIEDPTGMSVQEAVRNIDIRRFIQKTLSSEQQLEDEISMYYVDEIVLRLRGGILRDENGEKVGAVIVFGDITRLKELERVRQDFVANVSHELKTPVTAIKGYVETLMTESDRDQANREKFLEIILNHTDRLNAIIEDLLNLSRIERDSERREINLERNRIKPVLESSIEACRAKAGSKNMEIRLNISDDIEAEINPPLLEQAVTNLIDNAINYSDPGNEILIDISADQAEVVINIRDRGRGIEKKHIDRLFERFYRVDSARSRELGGTGLGLAIVKHIAQAHGGYPTVESVPEKGSVFSIHLPRV